MVQSVKDEIKEDAAAFKSAYAYLVAWKDMGSAKLLSAFLNAGIKVRFAEQPFMVNNRTYDRGTLIVTKAANKAFGEKLFDVLNTALAKDSTLRLKIEPVSSGFVDKGYDFGSEQVHIIKNTHVAMLTGEGINSEAAGEIWHYFEQQLNYPITLINVNDVARIKWKDIDELILPDGSYRFITEKIMADPLKTWVQQGGKLIASEGAVAQLAEGDWGIKLKKDSSDKKDEKNPESYTLLKKYGVRERDALVNAIAGAIYKVELDNTHPLAFGYPDYYFTLKQNDNIYEFLKKDGWNVGVLKKENYISGFVGSKTKLKFKDGLLFGVQGYGRGTIVYLADDLMFRSFWESGKLMFANAVFLVGQ